MEDWYDGGVTDVLKDRLIIAGMAELRAHGVGDFSLRRVATACGASCAAPYKHFKNKEDLITAVFVFIGRQWALLEEQLTALYGENPYRLIPELCVANVRFRLANPEFRAILSLDPHMLSPDQRRSFGRLTETVRSRLFDLYRAKGRPEEEADEAAWVIGALISGAVQRIDSGSETDAERILQQVRTRILRELPAAETRP